MLVIEFCTIIQTFVILHFLLCFSGDSKNNVAEEQKQLAWLVMEALTVLLQGSNTNAGACACVFFKVPHEEHDLYMIYNLFNLHTDS